MNLIRRGEYHAFSGGDARYLYLVPSAAVVRIDDVTQAILDALESGDRSPNDLTDSLADRWSSDDVRSSIDELLGLRAVHPVVAPPPKPIAENPSVGFRSRRSCST
jgi:hypothetical protein